MTAITTRTQFVELRNAFFSALNELHRQLPHASRVAAMSANGNNADNRAQEFEQHKDKIEEMTADYAILREISAMTSPAQKDFDLAQQIGKKWNVV